jgi:hypothetical protein
MVKWSRVDHWLIVVLLLVSKYCEKLTNTLTLTTLSLSLSLSLSSLSLLSSPLVTVSPSVHLSSQSGIIYYITLSLLYLPDWCKESIGLAPLGGGALVVKVTINRSIFSTPTTLCVLHTDIHTYVHTYTTTNIPTLAGFQFQITKSHYLQYVHVAVAREYPLMTHKCSTIARLQSLRTVPLQEYS